MQYSLYADRLIVKGDALLHNGFYSVGELRLRGAKIERSLDFSNSSLESSNGYALNLQHANVEDALILKDLNKKPIGLIDLSFAKIGQLADDVKSWPDKNFLHLDGFEYGALSSSSPNTLVERLKWLNLQPNDMYWPKSYEHLAKIYHSIGHDKDASSVLVEKRKTRRSRIKLGHREKIWDLFLQFFVGYGYKPLRALRIIIPYILFSAFIFGQADKIDIMQPSKNSILSKESVLVAKRDGEPVVQKVYPAFSPITYSIDSFIPFVNLHQEEYWLPSTKRWGGAFVLWWLWLHISAGWILSTILAAALAGLIKK